MRIHPGSHHLGRVTKRRFVEHCLASLVPLPPTGWLPGSPARRCPKAYLTSVAQWGTSSPARPLRVTMVCLWLPGLSPLQMLSSLVTLAGLPFLTGAYKIHKQTILWPPRCSQQSNRATEEGHPWGPSAPAAVPLATEQLGSPGTLEACGFLWHSRCNPLQEAAQVAGNGVRWQVTWQAGRQWSQGCGSACRFGCQIGCPVLDRDCQ